MRSVRRVFGLVAVIGLVVAGYETPSHAQVSPVPNWATLGQLRLDKDGCASCPATFGTTIRHRGFALATDSIYPISLTGRVERRSR